MSDRIILKGHTKLLKPIITQLLATHQLIESLDLGSGGDRDRESYPNRRYRPQIRLHFLQDTDYRKGKDSPDYQGRRRIAGRLTWRLMDETNESISRAELTRIGEQIKQVFGANGGYTWQKGKDLYCYADWEKGYQMQILARSASQARDLVSKILSLQGHSPQWMYLTKIENAETQSRYPETPVKKTILGQNVTLPKLRPNIEVRFTHADARIHQLVKPVLLYDRKHIKPNPLVQ